jgi:uncharacterized membrane protein
VSLDVGGVVVGLDRVLEGPNREQQLAGHRVHLAVQRLLGDVGLQVLERLLLLPEEQEALRAV